MFSAPVEIWDATVTAIHHKMKDGVLSSRLTVAGTLDESLAKELGANSLVFAENGTAKEGFSKLELSTGCAAFRALFQPDPVLKHDVEITGDSTDNYLVERKTKGGLKLKFRINYHGDPHQMLAYVMAIGSGEAHLRITPLQKELETTEDSTVSITVTKGNGETFTQPVDKDTVRQALAPSHKRRGAVASRREMAGAH